MSDPQAESIVAALRNHAAYRSNGAHPGSRKYHPTLPPENSCCGLLFCNAKPRCRRIESVSALSDCLYHRPSPLWLSTERMMATNATKVSTAFTACEYSHCRRAASKASGATVQLSVDTFIGYVNIQKTTCVAARQRAAATDIKKAARSLRIMKAWIEVRRRAAIIGTPKKDQPE